MRAIVATFLSFTLVVLFSVQAQACTLFGASGSEWVQGGGALVAKNRDWIPEEQDMRLINPAEGFKYYGLFAIHGDKACLRGGINEKGLVVFTASASSIPRSLRSQMPRYHGDAMKALLNQCGSVDEALQMNVFLGPQHFILADKTKVAYVEIGPKGKKAIKETANGCLYHTNHYVEKDMEWANIKIGESSATRYNRIVELFKTTPRPFTLDNFISFSEDQNDGDNNSIWRIGSNSDDTQTLGSLIVYLPPEGSPVMYVKIRYNSCEKGNEETFAVNVNDVFKK